MKVLDVASLNEGIHATLQEIEKIQSQLSGVQRSVRDIIALDQYLKGKTGEAIRSFYKQIHEPFLIYMHQSLTDYAEQLQAIKQAIQAFEPDKNGLIRQEFLDYNVKRSLDRTEDIAGDLVDQANREIASIGDLVSLPRLDMGELSFVVQKGRKKTREIVDRLHELDHTQTKNLAKVEEKLDVMKQYTSEMTRTFNQSGQMTHSFDFGSIYHLPTLPTLLKSIYGEPVVEEKKEDNFLMKGLKGTGNFIKKTAVTTYDVGTGAVTGLYDVVEDTAVGIYETFEDPKGTVESLSHSVTNPVETYKYIEQAIVDSYERDMINGDAESRSHWVAYALGTTATAVVGTKGAGALTKTGVATTKTAVQKSVTTVPNTMNTIQSSRLAQFLPYGPCTQVAIPGGVPSSVINGPVKRDELISMVKVNETKGLGNATRLIPGKPGVVTGGSSTKLGKGMMEEMGLKRSMKWSGYQAQHIIPSEMAKNHVIQKIGMNFDDSSNGIFLRIPANDISVKSRHRGYHSVYNQVTERALNKMDINQSVDSLQKQVYDLQRNLMRLQEKGLPLYPSQGATIELWERKLKQLEK